MSQLRDMAQDLIKEALKSVDPCNLVQDQMLLDNGSLKIGQITLDLDDFEKIFLIGAGKGAAPMVAAVEELLGDRLDDGVVSVKYGHGQKLSKTRLYEAGHPIPDENSLRATREILKIASQAGPKDLVLFLLTGGGSALMEALPEGISLSDLAELNRLLISCGAGITEINTIRKHISLVKGGQLARAIAPARIVTLILSDVIGDPLESIASGPTAPDPTTFNDALDIIKAYHLTDKVPQSVMRYLKDGQAGRHTDTVKEGDPVFDRTSNLVIGNNHLALERISSEAAGKGFSTVVLTDRAEGEAREIAKLLSGIFKSALIHNQPLGSPGCILLGGEPVVHITGKGKGGRNQELALAVLQEMQHIDQPFYFCSVGTDGTDGPTDAAGAWVDDQTISKIGDKGLDMAGFLENNDSYTFFRKIDQLIITGPTRTNVMDIMFFLF